MSTIEAHENYETRKAVQNLASEQKSFTQLTVASTEQERIWKLFP